MCPHWAQLSIVGPPFSGAYGSGTRVSSRFLPSPCAHGVALKRPARTKALGGKALGGIFRFRLYSLRKPSLRVGFVGAGQSVSNLRSAREREFFTSRRTPDRRSSLRQTASFRRQ